MSGEQLEAQALERKYKLDQKSLAIDNRYTFFALERKAVKDSAGASLGKVLPIPVQKSSSTSSILFWVSCFGFQWLFIPVVV